MNSITINLNPIIASKQALLILHLNFLDCFHWTWFSYLFSICHKQSHNIINKINIYFFLKYDLLNFFVAKFFISSESNS